MFRVNRPSDDFVLNCCVTETKQTPRFSNSSIILAKSISDRLRRSIPCRRLHSQPCPPQCQPSVSQRRDVRCSRRCSRLPASVNHIRRKCGKCPGWPADFIWSQPSVLGAGSLDGRAVTVRYPDICHQAQLVAISAAFGPKDRGGAERWAHRGYNCEVALRAGYQL